MLLSGPGEPNRKGFPQLLRACVSILTLFVCCPNREKDAAAADAGGARLALVEVMEAVAARSRSWRP